jgi:3-phosphoshikimate 1-carboxyvinyltransferase
MRALLFGMLSSGKATIENFLPSPDTDAMIRAATLFGARVRRRGKILFIEGGFGPASDVIDAGNSGLILRLVGGVSALLPTYTLLTGDHSIRENRPVTPLLEGLNQLGATAESSRLDGRAPLVIKGPIHPGKATIDGRDSQPVSALLIATSLLNGPSEIRVKNPGETPWIELTLHWLEKFGAKISHENYTHYHVEGNLQIPDFHYTVPGDFSTAAFPIAAALVTGSSLQITNLDARDPQGDKVFIEIIKEMGAHIQWSDTLQVTAAPLKGLTIDMNPCIDALPILAVLGCFAEGTTTLFGAAVARLKESDRISAITTELKKMGAHIEERDDGLIVEKSQLHGCDKLESHKDHRIALALSVAALGAEGPSEIHGIECIAKTYPQFIADFTRIGAPFELCPV